MRMGQIGQVGPMRAFASGAAVISLVLALGVLPALAPAADPTDELLRFVPADVAFCVSVRDLRGHSERLANSPFLEQWEKTELGKAFTASSQWQQWLKFEEQ